MSSKSDHLIDPDLCTRCGGCFAASTVYKLGNLSRDDFGFPVVESASDCERQELGNICTGAHVNYRQLLADVHGEEAASSYSPESPDFGTHLNVYVCRATRKELVERGQSGGVSTSLILAGLKVGIFDGFLAVRRPTKNDGDSPYAAEPFVVRNEDDLIEAAGSKYTITSSLDRLPELLETTPKFGASLLPCQTAGIRQLERTLMPELTERCTLIIGPFCGLNMNENVGNELAQALGIDRTVKFQNRAGRFPGTTRFECEDGETLQLDRTAHRPLYRMFSPNRCFSCTDFGNELSDITIADFWRPGKTSDTYFYPEGAAWLITRTRRGEDFLQAAVSNGFIEILERPDPKDASEGWKQSFLHRKVRAFNRIHQHKSCGIATPTFDFQLPILNSEFRTADQTEWFLRRIFRFRLVRKHFLRWWVRCHELNSTKPVSDRSKTAAIYLGKFAFTHRTDAHSVRVIFRNLSTIFFANTRWTFPVRFVRKLKFRFWKTSK